MTARIVQLAVSAGGVPKRPVAEVRIGPLGLAGDVQRNLKHHGGPERAVCLYSHEVIEALRAEGHPIAPGTTGENVTIGGLDWAQLAPGMRLALGAEVVLELTRDTTPCRTIMRAFADRKFSRISHKHHPGWSRWYARVLAEGLVRTGDPVTICPIDVAAGGAPRPPGAPPNLASRLVSVVARALRKPFACASLPSPPLLLLPS